MGRLIASFFLLPIMIEAQQACLEEEYPLASQTDYYATSSGARDRQGILAILNQQQSVSTVDPEARQYVETAGARLTAPFAAQGLYKFTFVLYDDSQPLNAPWYGLLNRRVPTIRSHVYAMPGGIVLVPVSLFDVTATESEFAAALARGVGHVVLRHFTRFANKPMVSIQPIPPAGRQQRSPGFTETLLFSRSLEKEADCAAVGLMAAARFNPEALLIYATRREASFDTSDFRVRSMQRIIAKLAPQDYNAGDGRQFEMLKARVRRRSVE